MPVFLKFIYISKRVIVVKFKNDQREKWKAEQTNKQVER